MFVQVFALFFFFKQKTAYEMRISDWSSDVCSSDLHRRALLQDLRGKAGARPLFHRRVPRRHRLARRLQFPVGLVLRPRGGAVRVGLRNTGLPLAASGAFRDTPPREPPTRSLQRDSDAEVQDSR